MACELLTDSESAWREIFIWLMLGTTVLMLLCFAAGYLLLGRRFDKIVGRGEGPDYSMGPISSLAIRPVGYAMLIVANPNWDKIMRRKGAQVETNPLEYWVRNYRNVDFRGSATLGQKIYSWVFLGSATVCFLILGPLAMVCGVVG